MREAFFIFRHYVRRALLDPLGMLILVCMPVVLIIILSMVFAEVGEVTQVTVNGYNMITSDISAVMFIMFQFFGGSYILDWLYLDYKSAKRWRLLSAPCSLNTFVLSAGMASWVFSMLQGILILVTSAVFLNAYLGNILVLIAVLLMVSLMGQFLFIVLFLLTKTKGAAEGLGQVFIQGMAFLSVWMENFGIENSPVMDFFFTVGTPMALARRAIKYSGFIGNDMGIALQSLGVLAVITIALGGITLLVGRRRSV